MRRFVGRDLVAMRQRQADVVQAVQQAVAAERLDLERNSRARARRVIVQLSRSTVSR